MALLSLAVSVVQPPDYSLAVWPLQNYSIGLHDLMQGTITYLKRRLRVALMKAHYTV